ncbi:MAG: hypothetical protein A2Z14_11030 [Chloroflexi bacterium RBG_16_48_8]|nr:MAG: hypothetical protein A2Z14_11030 [Chloroflexi bacterium RBG_16_48_8]
MVIADDDVGFDSMRPFFNNWEKGWGLLTMLERAESVGGQFRVESSRTTKGTRIIAEVPR